MPSIAALERELVAQQGTAAARPASFPGLLFVPLAPLGRRAGRAPDLRLHARTGRTPARTITGCAPAEAHAQDGRPVRRLHARTHAVRRAVLHGPDRFAVLPLRRRDHRQRLRGAQHEADDAHGARGARAHRARRQLRQGPAFDRRARIPNGASSCISPRSCRSRASARATAATRCSARSAMRCASRAGRRAPRAGSPSTC